VLLPFGAKKPIFSSDRTTADRSHSEPISGNNPSDGWQGRSLAFERVIKPQKQQAPIDGKSVNARVEFALENHNRAIPAEDHPWKNKNPAPWICA
jgi:hypothetical protein